MKRNNNIYVPGLDRIHLFMTSPSLSPFAITTINESIRTKLNDYAQDSGRNPLSSNYRDVAPFPFVACDRVQSDPSKSKIVIDPGVQWDPNQKGGEHVSAHNNSFLLSQVQAPPPAPNLVQQRIAAIQNKNKPTTTDGIIPPPASLGTTHSKAPPMFRNQWATQWIIQRPSQEQGQGQGSIIEWTASKYQDLGATQKTRMLEQSTLICKLQILPNGAIQCIEYGLVDISHPVDKPFLLRPSHRLFQSSIRDQWIDIFVVLCNQLSKSMELPTNRCPPEMSQWINQVIQSYQAYRENQLAHIPPSTFAQTNPDRLVFPLVPYTRSCQTYSTLQINKDDIRSEISNLSAIPFLHSTAHSSATTNSPPSEQGYVQAKVRGTSGSNTFYNTIYLSTTTYPIQCIIHVQYQIPVPMEVHASRTMWLHMVYTVTIMDDHPLTYTCTGCSTRGEQNIPSTLPTTCENTQTAASFASCFQLLYQYLHQFMFKDENHHLITEVWMNILNIYEPPESSATTGGRKTRKYKKSKKSKKSKRSQRLRKLRKTRKLRKLRNLRKTSFIH